MKSILSQIAIEAGNAIMKIYEDDDFLLSIDVKSDNSPLTKADKAAHHIIHDALVKHFPAIPVLSEEGKMMDYEVRKNWSQFWLVDPLDGTKEFIKRNGQFTVNIALIDHGYPTIGVIYVPVTKALYYADVNGAYKKISESPEQEISINKNRSKKIAVGSRSHASTEEEVVLNKYQIEEVLSKGSSLKFCMVAEGEADLYYRQGPTMEWDTAAGQAIVEAAGGQMLLPNGERFSYNKASLLNGSFYCLGNLKFI